MEFLVVEGAPSYLIIGNCVLKHIKAKLDLDNDTLEVTKRQRDGTFTRHVIGVDVTRRSTGPVNPHPITRQLVLREAFTVEPWSRARVPVQTPYAYSGDFVLHPREIRSGDRKLSAAMTLNSPDGGYAYADVTNRSPFPFRLEAGTVMGTASMHMERSVDVNVTEAHRDASSQDLEELVDQLRFGEKITPEERQQVVDMLSTRLAAFGLRGRVGLTNKTVFDFRVKEGDPISKPHHHHSPLKKKHVDDAMDELLERGFALPCRSPWASPTHVVLKDGKPRMVIDYRAVNDVTIPDQYPLPRIDTDILQRLQGMKYISVFDANKGFYQIPVTWDAAVKLAFRNHRGLFMPTRMPFGAKNAPAAFQRLMDNVLEGGRYHWCMAYIDDILVWSTSFRDHLNHVAWVLDRLIEAGLTISPAKTVLFSHTIDALGHTITDAGIMMGRKNVQAILDQPQPQTLAELERFIGLSGHYRQYLEAHSRVLAPVQELKTKTIKSGKKKLEWSPGATAAFHRIKELVAKDPMLVFPDHTKPFNLAADGCLDGVAATLSQLDDKGRLRPVCFISRSTIPAERNYSATDLECTAVAWALRKLRPIVEGCKVVVESDHAALQQLRNYNGPNRRMMRESLELMSYGADLTFKYKPGKEQVVVDQLSRCPLPITEADRRAAEAAVGDVFYVAATAARSATRATKRMITGGKDKKASWLARRPLKPEDYSTDVNAVWVTGRDDGLLEKLDKGILRDPKLTKIFDEILEKYGVMRDFEVESWPMVMKHPYSSYMIINGHLYFFSQPRKTHALVVPADPDLRNEIIARFHDTLAAAHRGVDKTYLAMTDHFTWTGVSRDVATYVRTCPSCQRNKASNQPPAGLLHPLPVPSGRWDSISMDFAGPFPSNDGMNAVLIVVDRLTKRVLFVPCHTKDKAHHTAQRFLSDVVRLFGLPTTIVTDRDPKFVSAFWVKLCELLRVGQLLCTSGHAQTDGQSEIMVRVMKQALRFYVNRSQSNWKKNLPFLEMACNSSVHASTTRTPYELDMGRMPNLGQIPQDIDPALNADIRDFLLRLNADVRTAQDCIQAAQAIQKRTHDGKRREVKYEVGQLVLLSTRAYRPQYLKSSKASPKAVKLWPTFHGPFKIVAVPSPNVVKIQLYPKMRIHPVINIEHIRPYHARMTAAPGEKVIEAIIDDRVAAVSRANPTGIRLWFAKFQGAQDGAEEWLTREQVIQHGGEFLMLAHDLLNSRDDDVCDVHDIQADPQFFDDPGEPSYVTTSEDVPRQHDANFALTTTVCNASFQPGLHFGPPHTSLLIARHSACR